MLLWSIGKQSGGIRGVSPEEEKKGCGGKDLQKRKVLSMEWKSEGLMDDESGESMQPMAKVPLVRLVNQKNVLETLKTLKINKIHYMGNGKTNRTSSRPT